MIGSIDPYKQKIIEKKEECLKKAKKELSDSEYLEFEQRINAVVLEIFVELQNLTATSRSMPDMDKIVSRSFSKMDTFAKDFFAHRNVYEKEHAERTAQLQGLNEKIGNMKFSSKEKTKSHSSERTAETLLEDLIIGGYTHELGHAGAVRFGLSAGILTQAVRADIPPESASPWRDRIISAAVHEVMSLGAEKLISLPCYITLTGIHAVGTAAKEGERSHQFNPAHAAMWNEVAARFPNHLDSYETVYNGIHRNYQMYKFPSEVIDGIHHECTHVLAKLGDRLGLTQENIMMAFQRTLEFLSKTCRPGLLPDVQEQSMWSQVMEREQRLKDKNKK